MSATKEKILNEISQLIGKQEGSPEIRQLIDDYNKITPRPAGYLMRYTDPWCAAGLSAVFYRCGALDIFPAECQCARMLAKASAMGILRYRNQLRFMIGDIIFYDWDKNGTADHVGILSEKKDGKLKVIECNKNNSVGIRIIAEDDTRILQSFIRPLYVQYIDFAFEFDDAYHGQYSCAVSSFLALRTGAGTNKEIIEEMQPNDIVQCYGYYTRNNKVWLLVVHLKSGKRGFCCYDYLERRY